MKHLKRLLAAVLLVTAGAIGAGEIDDFNTTDGSNTNANYGFPENMAPSAVNDNMRATQGILARWNKDIDGSIISYGTANAIKVTPNRTIGALYDGLTIAFEVTANNSGAVTIEVATSAAKNIRKSHDVALASGDLEAGQKIVIVYNSDEDRWQMLSGTAAAAVSAINDLSDVSTAGIQGSDILQFDGTNFVAKQVTEAGALGQGKLTIWIPAGAMVARTSTGAASGTVETSTNQVMVTTLDYDRDTDEFAQFNIGMPKSWNEGTISAIFYWTASNSTGVSAWAMQCVGIGNDDALDVAFGTAQTVTDTATAVDDLMISAETAAITVSNAAENDLVQCQVFQDADHADATILVDSKLVGVKTLYTVDAGNDD
jgi:hypothetical protein